MVKNSIHTVINRLNHTAHELPSQTFYRDSVAQLQG